MAGSYSENFRKRGKIVENIIFKPIYLKQNKGLGNALREAVNNCTNELIARMDSDDLSLNRRFELLLGKFLKNPDLDVVGSDIAEFIGDPNNIVSRRVVYTDDEKIKEDMKKRCAMNHVAVMYKKRALDKVGGYLDWYCNEDYYLWIRMLQKHCKFSNIPQCLVKVRTGEEMSARRGGWKYFSSEEKLQRYMMINKIISLPRYIYNVAIRFGGEIVIPNSLRCKLFKFTRVTGEDTQINKSENKKTDELLPNKNILKEKLPFSVAMSVYAKDNAKWFDQALESIIVNQTIKPNEVVLVVDGPIPEEIENVIKKYKEICRGGQIAFKPYYFKTNKGLGNALNVAIKHCTNELIARMDSDDIAISNRFEQQLSFFYRNPQIDILGGNIVEFIDNTDNIVGSRIVPCKNNEIAKYLKKRCPFNHMTVMLKKAAVLKAGNYQDWYWNEDYFLWIRMYMNDAYFANTGTNLVNVRVGKELYQRRGGVKYFKSEIKLQDFMRKNSIIGIYTYFMNCLKRFIVQVLLPNKMREWVFKTFAREKYNSN